MNLFFRLFVDMGIIKYIKGKRRPYVSTNDLDSERKLSVTYIEDRERRKKGEID